MAPDPPVPTDAAPTVLVRAARGSDAEAMADVQVHAWKAAYAAVLPEAALRDLDDQRETLVRRWRTSAEEPPGPRYHVLVAVEAGSVAGLAATGPAQEAPELNPAVTGEVLVLLVDLARRRAGHGSRLLAASVDHLRADGFVRAVAWVDEGEAGADRLLSTSGWAPDGATRTLDLYGDGTVQVRQDRWHSDITDQEGAA